MKEVAADPELQLQIIATGMHLARVRVDHIGRSKPMVSSSMPKVEMLLSSDSPVGKTKSMGLGVIGFADARIDEAGHARSARRSL